MLLTLFTVIKESDVFKDFRLHRGGNGGLCNREYVVNYVVDTSVNASSLFKRKEAGFSNSVSPARLYESLYNNVSDFLFVVIDLRFPRHAPN